MNDSTPSNLVLTVTQDETVLLRVDGSDVRMERLLLKDQARLIAVLANALIAISATQPRPSRLVATVDALEAHAERNAPPGAADAVAGIAAAVTAAQVSLFGNDTTLSDSP